MIGALEADALGDVSISSPGGELAMEITKPIKKKHGASSAASARDGENGSICKNRIKTPNSAQRSARNTNRSAPVLLLARQTRTLCLVRV
jgi:hypothetical protein